MNDPPTPPLIGPAPRSDIIMTSWHSENILNRNGPEETKTNISSHSMSHWKPANQKRGSCVFPVNWLAERCECWRAAEYFYSVAEELLPPGGEQKYTHRYLQHIQTDPVRDTSPSSGFWSLKHIESQFLLWRSTSCLRLHQFELNWSSPVSGERLWFLLYSSYFLYVAH